MAIAEVIGERWPSAAREATIALSANVETDAEALGLLLLRDIRDVFDQIDVDRISSAELVNRLKAMSDRPWARGGPITATRLARMLRPYGVRPGTIRLADGTPKGYTRAAFEEAWRQFRSRHNATALKHNELRRVEDENGIEREAS